MRPVYVGLLLALGLLLTAQTSFAQGTLINDSGIPRHLFQKAPSPATGHKTPPPPPDTLQLPFVDDFSLNSTLPDTNLWVFSTSKLPGISQRKGLHPPTKGVATFDGATFQGKKYKNVLTEGFGDELLSKPIDLSGKTAGDNIKLSFFVQPGGRNDPPESSDSLVVFFFTFDAASQQYDFEQVWSVGGDSLPTSSFTQVMIEVDQDRYFHDNFAFKFTNYGAIVGEVDVWHIDYVYLDENLGSWDGTFDDVSVIGAEGPIMGDYSMMPRKHYAAAANPMADFEYEVANAGNGAFNGNLKLDLSDPLGGHTFTTPSFTVPVSIPMASYDLQNVTAFPKENFAGKATFRVTASLNDSGTDNIPSNDTVVHDFVVDDVFALDDGVADVGFGMLSGGKGFAQHYTLIDSADNELTAVWINFVPTLHFNGTTFQSTCLEGKSFALTIWSEFEGKPDTIIKNYLANMIVDYGTSLNQFRRYYLGLNNELVVPPSFFVGIVQFDEKPIGVGVDVNFDAATRIYEQNGAFEWVNPPFIPKGCLMMRPEFGTTAGPISRDKPVPAPAVGIQVYPNPATEREIFVAIPGAFAARDLSLAVLDPGGRTVHAAVQPGADLPYRLALPETLPAGLYLLRVQGRLHDGTNFSEFKKFIHRPH